MARELTSKQRLFVAAYMRGISATQAAIEAGYTAKSARSTAHGMMKSPVVRAALERLQQHLTLTAEYNAEQAVQAIDAFIAKADKRGADSAIAKFHEQKLKLFGLLRDKIDITTENKVDVRGALAEAHSRVARLRCDSEPPIDGEFVALPESEGHRPPDKQSVAPFIVPLDMDA